MTKNKIIIGSRESALAVLQSEMVKSFLNEEASGITYRNPYHEDDRR